MRERKLLLTALVLAAGVAGNSSPAHAGDEDACAQPFWRDAQGLRHYKPQCVALEQYGEPDGVPPAIGDLTIVCTPRCDRIVDNGDELGAGHIFNRPVAAGRHMLDVSASNGVVRSLVVHVVANETKAVRVSMDPSFAAELLSGPLDDELGYLTITSYPWSKVSEADERLCVTPCARIAMWPGTHFLVLENEAGVEHPITVTIRRGETTKKRVRFE